MDIVKQVNRLTTHTHTLNVTSMNKYILHSKFMYKFTQQTSFNNNQKIFHSKEITLQICMLYFFSLISVGQT